MEGKQFSYTALMAAYMRGYHATNDNPKIFDDSLANDFLTEEERTGIGNQLVKTIQTMDPAAADSFLDDEAVLSGLMQVMISPAQVLSRARYMEDSLEEAAGQGVSQYLILGAGFETFAFRRPDLLEDIQVFEVDHPATQGFKRQRLAELGWEKPEQLHFIPLDFTREGLEQALRQSSFDPDALSFITWPGVTFYLPRDAVFSTLRAVAEAAPSGSTVIFDYFDKEAFIRTRKPESMGYTVAIFYGAD